MSEKNSLPPIIVDYVSKLEDPRATKFQKDLALKVLEDVVSECTKAVSKYHAVNKVKTARR